MITEDYKYKVEIILASGKSLIAYHKGKETDMMVITKKMFNESLDNFVVLNSKNGYKDVFIRLAKIDAIRFFDE